MCISLMSSKEWLDKYVDLLKLMQELDTTCPFIGNDGIRCDECTLCNKCRRVYDMNRIANDY